MPGYTGGARPCTTPGARPAEQPGHAIGPSQEFTPKALQDVNARRICPGCGGTFRLARRDQRHCRPSCRVLALRVRRQSSAMNLLAAGIAAGHVEPEVMP